MSDRLQSPHIRFALDQLLGIKTGSDVRRVAPFIFPTVEVPTWEEVILTTVISPGAVSGAKTILTVPEDQILRIRGYYVDLTSGNSDFDYLSIYGPSTGVQRTDHQLQWRIRDALTGSKKLGLAGEYFMIDDTANQTEYYDMGCDIWMLPMFNVHVYYDHNSISGDIRATFVCQRKRLQ